MHYLGAMRKRRVLWGGMTYKSALGVMRKQQRTGEMTMMRDGSVRVIFIL